MTDTLNPYYSAGRDAIAENRYLPVERCELCARWLQCKGQKYGKCGKKAWKTPSGDWCRFFTRETCDND